jgi:hypothetical protein
MLSGRGGDGPTVMRVDGHSILDRMIRAGTGPG